MTKIVALALLLVPISASAAPFGIDVLSTSYTATIEFRRSGATTTDTATDVAPVSSSLDYVGSRPDEPDYAVAAVSTDWLSVDLFSSARGPYFVTAVAISEVLFAPVADGIAAIGFDFDSTNSYTDSIVSLLDLADNIEIWRYAWRATGAPPPVLTTFDATHTYRLNLYGRTTSQGDTTRTYTRVTGLERVPEPATLVLLGAGLVGLGLLKRPSCGDPA